MKVKEYVERRRAGTTMLELHKILTQEPSPGCTGQMGMSRW